MVVILLAVAASAAALIGGYVAVRSRRYLSQAMALTSGLILGLVAFGLLPEIFEASEHAGIDVAWPMVLFVLGFLGFHTIEKLLLVHKDTEGDYTEHSHPNAGIARATVLAVHSFLDGMSIGVGFQVNSAVGTAVALAVIGHRFADGFDTANFMLAQGNTVKQLQTMLGAVTIMPVLGGLVSLAVQIPEWAVALYLGFFAGVLMYIAAGSILPQAHTRVRSLSSIGLTLVGAALMFVLTQLVGHV